MRLNPMLQKTVYDLTFADSYSSAMWCVIIVLRVSLVLRLCEVITCSHLLVRCWHRAADAGSRRNEASRSGPLRDSVRGTAERCPPCEP